MTLYFTVDELNTHNCEITPEIEANLEDLIVRMSKLREAYGKPMTVNSGLRSAADQARINPKAPHSKHMTGEAVDIGDRDSTLKVWVAMNEKLLEEIGLWCEDFGSTPGWVHFQSVPPKSGKRFFIP